jgi:hypothetical protein
MFVSREDERSCRCGLPRAEGRKGAAARGEGRFPVATTKSSNEASSRPSGQRVAAPFQAAERRAASRQQFVVRAGRRKYAFAPIGVLTAERKFGIIHAWRTK